MASPAPTEYQEAIQAPHICFDDLVLKQGKVKTDRLGLPKPISGNFAVVFQVSSGGEDWALRCFTTYHPDQQQRYAGISAHLGRNRLPCMVDFQFLAKGILVGGRWYPALLMEWVEGVPLNRYVNENLGRPQVLQTLAQDFASVLADLQRCGIGHGDLQHGNILVANGSLRLIDYDGMYVPALRGKSSHETGHRNYQHPRRTGRDFGPSLDNFSAWVIYLSLQALTVDPALWNSPGAGDDRLLFCADDFADPASSIILRVLGQHSDNRLRAIPAIIQELSRQTPMQVPPLEPARVSHAPLHLQAKVPPSALPRWLSQHTAPAPMGRVQPVVTQARTRSTGVPRWVSSTALPSAAVRVSLPVWHRVVRVVLIAWLLAGIAFLSLFADGILPLVVSLCFTLGGLLLYLGVVATEYSISPVVKEKRALRKHHRSTRSEVRRKENLISGLGRREQKEARRKDNELAKALRDLRAAFVATELGRCSISSASIRGIGPVLTGRLRARGVRTAADIDYYRVQRVHGVGQAKASALVSWRRSCESRIRARMPNRLPSHLEADVLRKYQQRVQHFRAQVAQAKADLRGLRPVAAQLERELGAHQEVTLARYLRQTVLTPVQHARPGYDWAWLVGGLTVASLLVFGVRAAWISSDRWTVSSTVASQTTVPLAESEPSGEGTVHSATAVPTEAVPLQRPTNTATSTATSSPTPTPTAMAAPSAAPTETPSPAPSPTPSPTRQPTETPTPPASPTPAVNPVLLSAPVLGNPAEGAVFAGRDADIVFGWEATGDLGPEEYYVLNVLFPHDNAEWHDMQWTKETSRAIERYIYDNASLPGTLNWYVVVMHKTGTAPDGRYVGTELGPRSEVRTFTWHPAGGKGS